MTWLALALGLCAAVASVEFLVTRVTERRAGRRLAAALRAPTRVRIRSWPAAVHLRNAGVRVTIRATDVPIPDRDATLTRLDVDLAGVTLHRGDVDGPRAQLRADDGAFTAVVDEDTLGALTPVPAVQAVEVRGGTVRCLLPGGLAVDGEVTVDDGDLVFTPTSGPLGVLRIVRLAAPLGRLPFGAQLEHLEVVEGELLAHGRLTDVTLDVS